MNFLYPQVFILLLLLFWLKRETHVKKEENCTRSNFSNNKILLISLIFTIIALSRPIFLNTTQKQTIKEREIIIALDISYSMRADDIKPNRLHKAKEAIRKILLENKNSHFSLFAFTTNPLILSPPTTDHDILMSALDSLNEEFILTHGTSLENLLKHIAKLKHKTKNLLIFSDGGDEKDLLSLKEIAKGAKINLFIVGVATPNGTLLHDKYGANVKDEKGHIVITRLNPILKDLGEYVDIDHVSDIIQKITYTNDQQKERVTTYELFWVPLSIAMILFIFAFISIPKKLLLLLPFLSTSSDAYIFDWYYISQAKNANLHQEYNREVESLKKIEPNTMQQIHLAHAYYKAGKYNMTLNICNNLKTTDKKIKKTILFLKANTLAKAGNFESARTNYIKALNIEEDKDIYHNLAIVLKELKNKKQALPNPFNKKLNKMEKKIASNDKNDNKKSNSKSSNLSSQVEQGLSGNKKNREDQKSGASSSLSHPLSYKAYSLINKGYIHEKNPW